MKISAALCSLALLAGSVVGKSHKGHKKHHDEHKKHHDEHKKHHGDGNVHRRGNYPNATVGISGPVQTRWEISQLAEEYPHQFSLFILAMRKWQATPQDAALGYYQIAGIHGVPEIPWNNVQQCADCSGAQGYCLHASIAFPAYHRAHVTLFEQELSRVAHSIANSWPTSGSKVSRAQMQNAASKLRMPYWDWAAKPQAGKHVLPGVISQPQITINGTSGETTINNPLYQYNFGSTNNGQLVYSPFVNWQYTLRYPNSDNPGATSQEGQAVAAFDAVQGSLQDQVYQLMTSCTDYLHFSNTNGGSGSTSCSNSLEGIHNTVHQTSGGPATSSVAIGGDMTYLAIAAFDPIFWLHHANVDRLFAIWQTLHSSYGATQAASITSWTIAEGQTVDDNTPVGPFTDGNGDFWTISRVKSWKQFGYTYPEFLTGGSQSQVAKYVNQLYGPSASLTAGGIGRPNSSASQDAQRFAANKASSSSQSSTSTSSSIAATSSVPSTNLPNPFTAINGSQFQYVANIQTPRDGANGSYTVYLFDGEPTVNNTEQFPFDSRMIGPMAVLDMGMQKQSNSLTYGSVPLTRTLQAAVQNQTLTDLTEMNVVNYLKNNLQWKIVGPGGVEITPTDLTGFKVSVFASTLSPISESSVLPTWSDFFPLEEVTKGKRGGLGGLLKTCSGIIGSLTGDAIHL